ncbi:MAG: glycosyltransferase 87 family protein [Thermoguttaceae bacterium]
MTTQQRWSIYWLLLLVSAGMMLGRIAAVDRVEYSRHASYEKVRSPALSANDRSRWDTIRALVEPSMRTADGSGQIIWYAIDRVQDTPGWDTIDMVKHRSPRSKTSEEFLYSSKPPLLPTLLAIPYAAIFYGSGGSVSLATHPYFVTRLLLVVCQLLPLLAAWLVIIRRIDRWVTHDVARFIAVAFVCFGTFLSTFVVTLNNHIFGFVAATFALDAAIRILFEDERRLRFFFVAGLAAAFCVACELPAAIFATFLGLWLLRYFPRQTAFAFGAGVVIVAAAFLLANYYPHGTLKPPYAMKAWYDYTYVRGGKLRESHWNNRVGMDVGEECVGEYFLHSTIGHHGIFSLTPIWLFAIYGALLEFRSTNKRRREQMFLIAATWLIVFVFYMARTQVDRNYGGMTCCLRWTLWLAALAIIPLIAALDRIATSADNCRRGRFVLWLVLIAMSVSAMSVAYPTWNPWSQPWLYLLFHWWGLPVLQ